MLHDGPGTTYVPRADGATGNGRGTRGGRGAGGKGGRGGQNNRSPCGHCGDKGHSSTQCHTQKSNSGNPAVPADKCAHCGKAHESARCHQNNEELAKKWTEHVAQQALANAAAPDDLRPEGAPQPDAPNLQLVATEAEDRELRTDQWHEEYHALALVGRRMSDDAVDDSRYLEKIFPLPRIGDTPSESPDNSSLGENPPVWNALPEAYASHGIPRELSDAHTPLENNIAERAIGRL